MRRYFYTSKKNGMDLLCNRCGKEEHVERVSRVSYNGGKLIPEKYEEPKENWAHIEDGVDLCESCNKLYIFTNKPADFFKNSAHF